MSDDTVVKVYTKLYEKLSAMDSESLDAWLNRFDPETEVQETQSPQEIPAQEQSKQPEQPPGESLEDLEYRLKRLRPGDPAYRLTLEAHKRALILAQQAQAQAPALSAAEIQAQSERDAKRAELTERLSLLQKNPSANIAELRRLSSELDRLVR